jgi:hypothetical protein
MMDAAGAHNANLEHARERIIRGASWKKQRIVVLIPAGESIPAKVALSHWNMIFPPNQGVVRILAQGMEVGEAYSSAIEQVLANPELSKWEYLLTVEHDNCPPPDGVLRLIERMEQNKHLACVGGLYFTKGEGGVPQIWGDPQDPVVNFRPQPPDATGGLVECCGTGMGFNLWRLAMFKDEKLRRPWFKTQADASGVGTQDLYAWTDFRKHGYRCAIDCGIRVGHYDLANDMMW